MESSEKANDRIPRWAIVTVIVGLIACAGAGAVELTTNATPTDTGWNDYTTPARPPARRPLGPDGSLQLTKPVMSSLDQNENGYWLYMISGVLRVDPGKWSGKATASCKVHTGSPKDTFPGRMPSKRSAWPRTSIDLTRQAVPDTALAKFSTDGNGGLLSLPIRNQFNRYQTVKKPIQTKWTPPFETYRQGWDWTIPAGHAPDGVGLAFAVIYRTESKPSATISCDAQAGPHRAATGTRIVYGS